MKTLEELYKFHTGRVSDKWTLYLREYDRILAPYRDKSISMLEIGIQNGGSLEIWSQYFPNAKKFVGCDINPRCGELFYQDPRISVVVGDATTSETREKILEQSDLFDLIIEDGSHKSEDIVRAFSNFFPLLTGGGVFIAEDLHCSYWEEYAGGIFYPYSSINFFKYLVDIVNHEHWGVSKTRLELISWFKDRFQLDISEESLSEIHSIEFLNSVCIIKKTINKSNEVSLRVVAGQSAEIVPIIAELGNTNCVANPQDNNHWSTMVKPPAESYDNLLEETELLKKTLINEQAKIEELQHTIEAIITSRSWRYSSILRKSGDLTRSIFSLIRRVQASRKK